MLIQTQGTTAGATMPVTGTTTPSIRDASIRELREMILSSLKDISSDPALIRDFMAFCGAFMTIHYQRILILSSTLPPARWPDIRPGRSLGDMSGAAKRASSFSLPSFLA